MSTKQATLWVRHNSASDKGGAVWRFVVRESPDVLLLSAVRRVLKSFTQPPLQVNQQEPPWSWQCNAEKKRFDLNPSKEAHRHLRTSRLLQKEHQACNRDWVCVPVQLSQAGGDGVDCMGGGGKLPVGGLHPAATRLITQLQPCSEAVQLWPVVPFLPGNWGGSG